MKLSLLLQTLDRTLKGADEEIRAVCDDSRACGPGSLFVCHDAAKPYIAEARANGALAVVTTAPADEDCYVVHDTRQAYAALSRCFFGEADRALTLVAVTGTNGKTTVASMLHHILSMQGRDSALLSTVTNAETADGKTTPDAFSLHRTLRSLAQRGKEICVMEASSQGLSQERLYGLHFRVGIFTNLTREHLDYHGSFEAYRDAKKKLFSQCDVAVLNRDDPSAQEMADACEGEVVTYSLRADDATFSAKSLRDFDDGQDFALVSESFIHRVKLHLFGTFNVENAMAAILAARALGVPVEDSAAALRSFHAVKGRMELLETDTPFRVMIDYAHTPDSLRQVLLTLRRVCKGRLILLFGCGGERDRGKRAEMGAIAARNADLVILTGDNPRGEDPDAILNDILQGVGHSKTPLYCKPDRREAIALALRQAKENDLVLLCGKGHETTMQLADGAVPFDERAVVRQLLQDR